MFVQNYHSKSHFWKKIIHLVGVGIAVSCVEAMLIMTSICLKYYIVIYSLSSLFAAFFSEYIFFADFQKIANRYFPWMNIYSQVLFYYKP